MKATGATPGGGVPAVVPRSLVYKVLAKAFDYPDTTLFPMAISGEVAPVLRRACEQAGNAAQQEDIDAALGSVERGLAEIGGHGIGPVDLETEYNRLFLALSGSVLCPPYETETLRLNPAEKLNSLADLMGFYRAWGLDLSDRRHEFPDHIATELEFMHFLAYKEESALARGEAENARLAVESVRHFIDDHLLAWLDNFCAKVTEHSAYECYRGLARFTRVFVFQDRARLQASRA